MCKYLFVILIWNNSVEKATIIHTIFCGNSLMKNNYRNKMAKYLLSQVYLLSRIMLHTIITYSSTRSFVHNWESQTDQAISYNKIASFVHILLAAIHFRTRNCFHLWTVASQVPLPMVLLGPSTKCSSFVNVQSAPECLSGLQ